MRLAAIYIQEHYLYGKYQAVNFGGQYFYSFDYGSDTSSLMNIKREENKQYIKDFFGNLTNMAAIVGNNGAGKTSLMRVLNGNSDVKRILVYEHDNDDKVSIYNKTTRTIETLGFGHVISETTDHHYPLFYSPILDENLKDIHSELSQTSLFRDSLLEYHLDNIKRHIYLFNDENFQALQNSFSSFPEYHSLTIGLNNISKSQLLNIYKDSDIGKNMKEAFRMLWSSYSNFDADNDIVNTGLPFIEALEITLLSLLIIDDTFILTNSVGRTIGFQRVIDQPDFLKKLDIFLAKTIDNNDKVIYQRLMKKTEISIENMDVLIDIIKADSISVISGGFDFKSIKRNIIHKIRQFKAVQELYLLCKNELVTKYSLKSDNEFHINVKDSTHVDFIENFFKTYEHFDKMFADTPFKFRLLNINSATKLSSGERGMLNFFAALHNFTLRKNYHTRQHQSYLLLLDEPEQGFHPMWKKNFINACVKVIPQLFSYLPKKPSVQVIFTTHDPLTLSDIPKLNITYLSKTEEGLTQIEDSSQKKSFGANITDLLTDSFFLEDGLVGDFAKEKINSIITWLSIKKLQKEVEELEAEETLVPSPLLTTKQEELKLIIQGFQHFSDVQPAIQWKQIQMIDEPILRIKLQEMYAEIFEEEENIEDAILLEIQRLAEKLGKNVELKDKDE